MLTCFKFIFFGCGHSGGCIRIDRLRGVQHVKSNFRFLLLAPQIVPPIQYSIANNFSRLELSLNLRSDTIAWLLARSKGAPLLYYFIKCLISAILLIWCLEWLRSSMGMYLVFRFGYKQ